MSIRNIALGALLCGLVVLGYQTPIHAQNAIQAMVTNTCGTPTVTLTQGKNGPVFQDTTGTLCTKGSSGTTTVQGSSSNASSGVATSSTNLGTISYNYAWNGTTWDQVKSKPASTAAIASDTSVVMQLNPLSPGIIPLGPAAVASSLPTAPSSQYPTNGTTTVPTAITGRATGSTGSVVGTLTATASATTYICGFDVSAVGGTAAVGPVVVAGLIGGSFTYQMNSAATAVLLSREFTPCIPASAVNTTITVTTTADGTATAVDVNMHGYQL